MAASRGLQQLCGGFKRAATALWHLLGKGRDHLICGTSLVRGSTRGLQQLCGTSLVKGEIICARTTETKVGELFKNMFYLKQVELNEKPFILGLQARLPDEWDARRAQLLRRRPRQLCK